MTPGQNPDSGGLPLRLSTPLNLMPRRYEKRHNKQQAKIMLVIVSKQVSFFLDKCDDWLAYEINHNWIFITICHHHHHYYHFHLPSLILEVHHPSEELSIMLMEIYLHDIDVLCGFIICIVNLFIFIARTFFVVFVILLMWCVRGLRPFITYKSSKLRSLLLLSSSSSPPSPIYHQTLSFTFSNISTAFHLPAIKNKHQKRQSTKV